jgi:hypothetical protein
MGLNTIHAKSKDLMTLYNVTKGKYFKAELMQSDNQRDYQMANGLDFLKIKHIIKVNGSNIVELRDKIKFGKNTFQAVMVQPKIDNMEQFRHRSDIDNFTGETVIYLE